MNRKCICKYIIQTFILIFILNKKKITDECIVSIGFY